jgi:hypothetical protein
VPFILNLFGGGFWNKKGAPIMADENPAIVEMFKQRIISELLAFS